MDKDKDKDAESHCYLFNNILDDDKEIGRDQINLSRTTSNYSAPPSITLYDYDDLERQILFDQNEESEDTCEKLPPKSPTKIPKRHKYSFDGFDEVDSGKLTKMQSLSPEPRFKYSNPSSKQIQPPKLSLYPQPCMQVPQVPQTPQNIQYMPYYHYPSEQEIHNIIMSILSQANEMAKERNNSKTLQYYFEIASNEDKELIFRELLSDSLALAQDPFGNYVIQKMFEVGTKYQKQRLADVFKGKVTGLAFSPFGCRVVQRLIESLVNEEMEQIRLMKELSSNLLKLILDQNGNHVVQKLFECFPEDRTSQVSDILFQNISKIGFHSYGCRVLQKFLQRGSESEMFKKIMAKLSEMMIQLCKCSYGNYIMQYLVVHGPLEQKNKILDNVKSNFVVLSLDKFASNVVEKVILNGTEQLKKDILKILQSPYKLSSEQEMIGFVILARGQYSNYVIQRYLERSPRFIHQSILALIPEGSQNLVAIKESQYGRHVLAQLGKAR